MTRLEERTTEHDSFEQRWAQWQAKGRGRDRRLHRRMITGGVLACVSAAAFWSWVVIVG